MREEFGQAVFHAESGDIQMVRHVNPDGSIGGWIAPNQHVPENVYIDPFVTVVPGAKLQRGQVIKDVPIYESTPV